MDKFNSNRQSFTCQSFQTEFRHPRVFREQLVWLFVKFLCLGSKPENHVARNLREFGVAPSEELHVNQWIALDVPTLSSQSERAKKHYPLF